MVEQIDCLTGLSNSGLRIVSLEVPTSWQALPDKAPSQADSITCTVEVAMSHKDWLSCCHGPFFRK